MQEVKYNINFLKSKGFFKRLEVEKINNKETYIDPENIFAYVEVNSNEEVEKFKRLIKENFERIKYIWFYFPKEGKIKVYRSTGEIKWFYYNPNRDKREVRKSKESKLNKFSTENPTVLFDIRDIVNKFYNELWKIRIEMAKSIKDLKEDGNKLLVSQRFIDRMIFFYFLSQLGLVKVKNEEYEWKLDRTHTREFFEWLMKQLKSDYKILEFMNKIFFDILGIIDVSGWSKAEFKIGGEKFSIVAPSLDGGLFREDKFEGKKEREITFKGVKKLIELLNQYNWIIGEELPEEDRVGDLTPEIIGHIYEKIAVSLEQMGTDLKKIKLNDIKTTKEGLKVGRKKVGAYYTPEEITNYISKNTIFPFIKDKLEEKFGKKGRELLESKSEKYIFNKKAKYSKKELEMIKYLYFEILTKIKICDNACGSGSFLIAAGDILLRLYSRILKILEENLSEDRDVKQVLERIRNSPSRNYYIVRQIIVNNLYGVDIMDGAVEIAKLRFWLWLISQIDPKKVEGKRIETLPNLDFNLMVGNSLIGFIDIEDIEFDFLGEQKTITAWLGENKTEWLKNLAKKKQEFKTLPAHEAVKLKEKLNKDLEKAREFLNKKFYEMLKAKGIKISWEEFLKLKPFHWGFEFYEVFDLEKPKEERGFDVIIGNPPYGNILSDVERKIIDFVYNFETTITDKNGKGSHNSASVFIERSYTLLKIKACFGYIVPNSISRTEEFEKIRNFLLNCTYLYHIVDAANPFVGVTLEMIIIFFRKIKNKEDYTISIYSMRKNINKNYNKVKRSIFEKYDRFMLYWDKIWETCFTDSITLKFDLKEIISKSLSDNKYKTLKFSFSIIKSGKAILRYMFLPKSNYLIYGDKTIQNNKAFFEEKIIIPTKLLGLRATIKPKNIGCYNNVKTILYQKNKKLDEKFLLVLLNSSLLNYFFKNYILNNSEFTIRIVPFYLNLLPIKLPPTQQPFIILADYMLFLNATEERRTKEKDIIEFLDKQIIDSLVYELYFKEKFYEDKLYPKPKEYLLELVSKHLKPINYDRWSELYWKKQLGEKLGEREEKELKKLEKENVRIVEEVIEKIKSDNKIMDQIGRIKNHEWVKIVEGKE